MKIIIILMLLLLTACTETPTINCPVVTCPEPTVENTNLKLHMIDVGQGDSLLIQHSDTEMLIDCGVTTKGLTTLEYIQGLGITDIEYLLITHPDSDHMGGCYDILNNLNVNTVITNGQERDNVFFKDVMSLIDTEQLIVANEFDQWAIGEATMSVLQSNRNDEDINQNSIVSMLSYRNTKVLFTGDCDKECEKELLNKDIKADILKVTHHGSKYGTEIDFLEKVNPGVGLIPVGLDNRYGHPTQETLDRLSQEGVVVYRTDYDGDVVIEINDNSYEVSP